MSEESEVTLTGSRDVLRGERRAVVRRLKIGHEPLSERAITRGGCVITLVIAELARASRERFKLDQGRNQLGSLCLISGGERSPWMSNAPRRLKISQADL